VQSTTDFINPDNLVVAGSPLRFMPRSPLDVAACADQAAGL